MIRVSRQKFKRRTAEKVGRTHHEPAAGGANSSPEPLAGRAAVLVILLVALTLTAVAYWPATGGDFVYDDHFQIVDNPLIQQPGLFGRALMSDVWAFRGVGGQAASNYWRPLFVATLSAEFALFGARPAGWHLVNLALQGLVVVLAFFVLRSLGARWEVCAAGVWLFAVHPAHVESVAWISGSPDLLVAVFLFGAWLFHAAGGERGWTHRGLAAACFACALLSKEIAIVFPILVFGSELGATAGVRPDGARLIGPGLARSLRATFPYVAVAAVYLLVRISLVGMTHVVPPGAPSLSGVVLSAPALLLFYLRRALLPVGLSPSYAFTPVAAGTVSLANFGLPLVTVIAIAIVIWSVARHQRFFRWMLLWFALPLAPAFDVRSFASEDMVHDRYLYLPLFGLIGFLLAAGTRLPWARSARRAPAIIAGGGLALALLLVPVTRAYARAWGSDVTLWEVAIRANPETAFPHAQLADAYRRAGRLGEARAQLDRALTLNPGLTTAHLSLAALDRREGRLQEAEQHLALVLGQHPDQAPAIDLLGLVYQDGRRFDDGIRLYDRGRKLIA